MLSKDLVLIELLIGLVFVVSFKILSTKIENPIPFRDGALSCQTLVFVSLASSHSRAYQRNGTVRFLQRWGVGAWWMTYDRSGMPTINHIGNTASFVIVANSKHERRRDAPWPAKVKSDILGDFTSLCIYPFIRFLFM
jgi:hypothetical protein